MQLLISRSLWLTKKCPGFQFSDHIFRNFGYKPIKNDVIVGHCRFVAKTVRFNVLQNQKIRSSDLRATSGQLALEPT